MHFCSPFSKLTWNLYLWTDYNRDTYKMKLTNSFPACIDPLHRHKLLLLHSNSCSENGLYGYKTYVYLGWYSVKVKPRLLPKHLLVSIRPILLLVSLFTCVPCKYVS